MSAAAGEDRAGVALLPLRLALIGFGAIGRALADGLRGDGRIVLSQVVVPSRSVADVRAACATLAPAARVLDALDLGAEARPGLVAECAGHAALDLHVAPALRAGVPCVVASIGALHDAALLARLEAAAVQGGAQVRLVAGAIGAIDALAAARIGGLDAVTYVGRKPPRGWAGTPAEQVCDLTRLAAPQVIFRGTAREAARLYPKNANVAATVSLAGLGLDRTTVELVADPGVERNVHEIVATGAFGELRLRLENRPLAANPKTSALTAWSLLRAVRERVDAVVI